MVTVIERVTAVLGGFVGTKTTIAGGAGVTIPAHSDPDRPGLQELRRMAAPWHAPFPGPGAVTSSTVHCG